jgi:hypothetical protein
MPLLHSPNEQIVRFDEETEIIRSLWIKFTLYPIGFKIAILDSSVASALLIKFRTVVAVDKGQRLCLSGERVSGKAANDPVSVAMGFVCHPDARQTSWRCRE